jgi:hypothetical protein
MGEERKAYMLLAGNPERKNPIGRSRRGWVDNIEIYLDEIVLGGVDGIDLVQNRNQWRALVNTVMNLRVL